MSTIKVENIQNPSSGTNDIQIDVNGNVAVDTNTLYVDTVNNRVGIGTTSPGALLNLEGNTNASLGALIYNSNALVNTEAALELRHNRGNVQSSTILSAVANAGGTADLKISVSGSERARIDSSGRLLVGTSSAETASLGALFQIQATGSSSSALIKRNDNGALPSYLYLGKSRGTTVNSTTIVQNGDSLGAIRFTGADGSTEVGAIAAQISAAVDGTPGANDMPGRLIFSTTADGASSPTERMRIDNAGSIYFGSTSATAPSMYFGPDSAGGRFIKNTNSTNSRTHFTFQINGTDVGSITTSGSSTAYNTSSDYRLKENVTPVTDGITRLQQLKPSRFNFIADPGHTVDGFLAHEAQAVVPECVTGEKDAVDDEGKPVYQGIDQSKLVPLLTAALQEAIGEIESLKARVAALESA